MRTLCKVMMQVVGWSEVGAAVEHLKSDNEFAQGM